MLLIHISILISAFIRSTEPVKNLKDIHFFICTPRDYQRISDSRHLVLQYLEVPYEIDDISNLWHFLVNPYAPYIYRLSSSIREICSMLQKAWNLLPSRYNGKVAKRRLS